MIELNLLGQKKAFKLPTVLGVDLGAVNIKMLLFAIFLNYTPDMFLVDYWSSEVSAFDVEHEKLSKELRAIKKDIRGNNEIKEQLREFNNQVDKLRDREKYVAQIISQKSNPIKVLLHIAKTAPEDLWLEEVLFESRNVNILGRSLSYKSIGSFIQGSNSSIFFNNTLKLESSETKEDPDFEGKRNEFFNVVGKIERFD